jgi:hypothetical protein
VYTLVCNAIHNEMAYIFTSGDDAVRLTPQGTLDTGIGDSSYDGGATTFNTDDAAPIGVRPSPEWWSPPAIWAEWTRMVPRGRAKLLADSGLTLEHVNTGWNDIPWEDQIKIEDCWRQTAKGVLRANKYANGTAPYNPYGFISTALPHPDELALITPPRLRAVAMLVYRLGFYADGGSNINAGEISKVIGRSARTVLRDHTELMKLWGGYVRSDAVAKRDENKFPRYPLHTNIAEEFSNMPADAQMPAPSNPVPESVMMPADRARELYERMKKYHTDFSDATVTATIVTPRAVIYECGPRPSAFKIIAGFENPVPESEGHTQTIDSYHNGRVWVPIRSFSDKSKMTPLPRVWLHDWSASDWPEMFASPPRKLFLTTQRSVSVPLYPSKGEEKRTYCDCRLCQHLRREARRFFADAMENAALEDDEQTVSLPMSLSPLTLGMLHGQDRPAGVLRYKETHFLCI